MTDEKKSEEQDKPAEETEFDKIARENAAKKRKREQERQASNKAVLRSYRIKN